MASITSLGGFEIARIGLSEVYRPPSDIKPAAHIVFVHGLFGHPYKTWCGTVRQIEESKTTSKTDRRSLTQSRSQRSSTPTPPPTSQSLAVSGGSYEVVLDISGSTDEDTAGEHDSGASTARPADSSAYSWDLGKQAPQPPSVAPINPEGGAKTKTNKSKDIFWPAALLPNQVPAARIWTWGYDADIARFGASSGQNTVFHHASNLLSDLADLQEQPNAALPLIFVVHSLGGIVVKAAINQSSQTEGTRLKSIVPAVYSICFFGTPHRGSSTASLGKMAYQITTAATARPNLRLISALQKNSDTLDQIGEAFLQVQEKHKFRVYSFREEKEIRRWIVFNTIVVKPDSAKIGIPSEEVGNIPENHTNMTKFSKASDTGYKRVSHQISKWVKEIVSANDDQVDSDCLISLNNMRTRLRFKAVTEAHPKTFHWLFNRNQVPFIDWIEGRTTNPLFWIKGKPGSGKSTLMKFAIQDTRTKKHLGTGGTRWVVAGFFFHDRGASLQKSLSGMLQELLYQTVVQDNKLEAFVQPIYAKISREQRTKEPVWDFDSLRRAFMAITTQRTVPTCLCLFLDALDEHDEKDEAGNNQILAELLYKIAANCDGEVVKIRMCLASRPWNIFEKYFNDCPGFAIHEYTQADVEEYTSSRLRQGMSLTQNLNETVEGQLRLLRDAVTTKAQGVFIWVRLVVDELVQDIIDGTTLEALQEVVYKMPEELKELYHRTITRIRGGHMNRSYVMMQVALYSLQPLALETFIKCVSYILEDTKSLQLSVPEEDLIRQLNGISGGLLEAVPGDEDVSEDSFGNQRRIKVRNGSAATSIENSSGLVVQFIHQTVKDFVKSSEQIYREKCSRPFPSGYYSLLAVAAQCDDRWAESIAVLVFEYAAVADSELSPINIDDALSTMNADNPGDTPLRFRNYVAHARTPLNKGLPLTFHAVTEHSSWRVNKWLSLAEFEDYMQLFNTIGEASYHRLFYLAVAAHLVNYVRYMIELSNWTEVSERTEPDMLASMQIAAIGRRISSSKGPRSEMIHVLSKMRGRINSRIDLDNVLYLAKGVKSLYSPDIGYSVLGVILVHGKRLGLAKEEQLSIAEALLECKADPQLFIFESYFNVKSDDDPFTTSDFSKSFSYLLLSEDLEMIRLLRRHGAQVPVSFRKYALLWKKIPATRRSDILQEFIDMADDLESLGIDYPSFDEYGVSDEYSAVGPSMIYATEVSWIHGLFAKLRRV